MAEKWISSQTQSWGNGTGAIYAITDKSLNTLFGTVSLVSIKNSHAELGYWVGEPYWKNGYCTEAAKALIEFAFTRLGIVKVVAEHLSSNPASGRVMEKIGMRHVHQIQKIDRNGKKAKIEFYVL
jgi:RimJ/RimL family protein N-acetyltransferase